MTKANTKKKPALPSTVFPDGTFKWPKINKPDFGSKEYPNPDGAFKVSVVYRKDSPEFKRLMKEMQPHYEDALAKGEAAFADLKVADRKKLGAMKPKLWYSEIYDEDTEEPTGEVEVRAKTKFRVKGKDGKIVERKVPIFDASGKPMKNPPEIWGGTTGAVAVSIAPYFVNGSGEAGLTFYLNSAQIIDLVTSGGGRSADSYGFAKREGGYSHDDTEDTNNNDNDTDSEDDEAPFDTDEGSDEDNADF